MSELVVMSNEGKLAELPVGRFLYTGDPKDRKQQQALVLAVQGKPPSLADLINTEIEVVNLLYHKVQLVDPESGEAKVLPRLCVFCKDGKVYSTSGQKAIKDALMPAVLFGFDLPYNPPQRFKVTKTKTRPDGGGYINLEWIQGAKS